MPIQIIHSGVKLSDPKTISTVVFRNESGVVCRISSAPRSSNRRRGSVDVSDGEGLSSSGTQQHTTMLAVADGGGDGGFAGEGGQASLPYDMTSVFGLKVHRLTAEELAAEEQSKRKGVGSTAQTSAQQPETAGGNASNASGMPGSDKDTAAADAAAAETLAAEVWISRPGGSMQSRGPAYRTLAERVRQGNDLVSDTLLCGRCIEGTRAHDVKT
ncbi:unnamed protein product [Pylaiella littoralis]